MTTYVPHRIRVRLPGARQVSVVGDFNNWHSNAHPLVQVGAEEWERIVDLQPGKHRYAFFVIEEEKEGAGTLRSRVVGNGAVLWVPEDPEAAVSVTGEPGLRLAQVA